MSYSAKLLLVLFMGAIPLLAPAQPGNSLQSSPRDLSDHSLSQLQERLDQIDATLEQLAHHSLLGGVGAIGYRSLSRDTSDTPEWIEITLAEEASIDEIMLVPAIWRNSMRGPVADGFPKAFRVVLGRVGDKEGTEIASYSEADEIQPGTAPFIIPADGRRASWVRVEASKLSARGYDGRFVLQFSEILAFSGQENVALRQAVSTSSEMPLIPGAWNEVFVVDGFVPYVMDATSGEQSLGFVSAPSTNAPPIFALDLGTEHPLSRIQLHAVEQGDTVPRTFAGDFGIPKHLRVEGANHADFSDAVPLVDVQQNSVYECGPIMTRRFSETSCRYVRLSAVGMEAAAAVGKSLPPLIAFAEIELFAKDINVALGKAVQTRLQGWGPERSPTALTDGRNLYGTILPTRDWLNELTHRQSQEWLRPRVVAELDSRYARQKRTLMWLTWLAVASVVVTLMVILYSRGAQQRAVYRTRQQIAADLHDELGANLHAIGLLGDLAMRAGGTPERLQTLLQRSRSLTERTAAATRYCTNMLETDGLHGDLAEDMHRASLRLLTDLEHDIRIEGKEALARLKPRKRVDVFLFYKESLINIIRHSEATRVTTQLKASPKQLSLTITDNGRGMAGTSTLDVPSSLKRRARLLGAKVTSERPAEGGTRITLTLRLSRHNLQ